MRARALRLLLVLLLGCDGGSAPPPPPPPPATVPVVQAVPAIEGATYGWLPGRGLAFIAGRDAVAVWDPESGRVVDVHGIRGDGEWTEGSACARPFAAPGGLVCAGHVLRAELASWSIAPTNEDDWQAGPRSYAPSLERWARVVQGSTRELVLSGWGRDDVRLGVEDVSLAWSADGLTLATCSATAVELRDGVTGAWRARFEVAADGGCHFSLDGGVVVALERDAPYPNSIVGRAVLVDVRTGARIGAALENVGDALVARAGAPIVVATRGTYAGFSVLDPETRATRAHVAMASRPELALRGDAWIVASGEEGGVFSIETGERVTAGPLELSHVAEDGRALRVSGAGPDATLEVVEPRSGAVTRLRVPLLSSPRLEGTLLVAGARHAVDLAARPVATDVAVAPECPPVPAPAPERGVVPPPPFEAWLRGPRGLAHVDGTCLAPAGGEPRVIPEPLVAGPSFVVVGQPDGVFVHDADGVRIARLELDPGESSPCTAAGCPMPIETTSSLVVMARNEDLRVFDATTGARLGRARVDRRTRSMSISPSGARLVHVGEDERATLFELPTLRPLQVLSPAPGAGYLGLFDWMGERLVEGAHGVVRVVNDGGVVADIPRPSQGWFEPGEDRIFLELDPDSTRYGDTYLEIRSGPGFATATRVDGAVRFAAARAVIVVRDGHDVLLTFPDGAPREDDLGERASDDWTSLSAAVIATRGPNGLHLVRLADRATVDVVVIGDDLVVIDGTHTLADDGGHVLLRRPTLSADGMIAAPARAMTLGAWLDGP